MSDQSFELNGRKFDWHDLLAESVTMPGRFGDTYSRFYPYSYANQALLMMQWPPEPMATYKRWEAMGRQVQRGARAKSILRPIIVKREDANGDEHAFTRFKLVKCLFGASETEGQPLPDAEPRTWNKAKALGSLAINEVPFRSLDGNTQGYSYGREFAINPVAKYPLKTTLHELGHIVLGHTTPDGLSEYRQHRGVKEFQAEGVAYLCGKELEVDMDHDESRAYIQHWLQDEHPPVQSVKQVFAATTAILKAGWVEPEPEYLEAA